MLGMINWIVYIMRWEEVKYKCLCFKIWKDIVLCLRVYDYL